MSTLSRFSRALLPRLRSAHKPKTRARLRLEHLEARLAPAVGNPGFEDTAADNPNRTLTVEASDSFTAQATNTTSVTVNVAPTVTAGPDVKIGIETPFTATGAFTDPGAETWTAVVDYGDGSGSEPLTLSGETFALSHQYATPGAYIVTVTVTDSNGAAGTGHVVVTVNPVPANVLFVRQLYLDVLSRPADHGGETAWATQLDSGESRLVIVQGLRQSLESLNRRVDALYQSILYRTADPGGRASWVGALQSGVDEEDIKRAFILSPEYQSTHASDAVFLIGLYHNILGRDPDASGVANWGQRLREGTSRSAVAQAIQTSAESHSVSVDRIFRQFLDRGPDLRAFRWGSRLASGYSTLTEVAANVLASDAYLHESVLTPNRTPGQSPLPVGDGVADDTAAVQALLDQASASGGEVRLGPGRYRITTTLVIDGANVGFVGEGGAVLVGDGEGFPIVRINNPTRDIGNVRVEGLQFDSLTPRNSGAGIDITNCLNAFVERCWIERQAVGVLIRDSAQVYVTDTSIRELTPVKGIGILIDGGGDQYLRDVRIVGHPTEPALQPACGVSVLETWSLWMENVGTINAGTGLRLCPPRGNVIEFLFSTQCGYDSGTGYGILIGGEGGSVRSLNFEGDWASSNGLDGVLVRDGADIQFRGMRCFINLGHGMELAGSDFLVDGGSFSGNGSIGSPNYHGIVLNRVQGARIVNSRSGQVAHFGNHQGYGLFVASSAASDLLIDNNDFRSNITAGWYLQGTYQTGQNWA